MLAVLLGWKFLDFWTERRTRSSQKE